MSKNTNLSFLTDYITADITNGRIGINTPSPTVAFDVTGVAKFSSSVTAGTKFISSVGNNNIVFESLSATTGYQYIQLLNTTAHTIFGIEGTAAGSLLTSGLAYGSVFTSVGNTALQLGTNQTARLTISAAGNVGIGTTSPSSLLNTYSATTATQITITGADTTNQRLEVTDGTVTNRFGIFGRTNGDAGTIGTQTNHSLVFNTNSTERMRITNQGELFFGCTTQPGAGSATTGTAFGPSGFLIAQRNAGTVGFFGRGTNDGELFAFYRGTTQVGSISVTTSLTSYNVTSDYRLKQDLKPIKGLEIVNKIKVYDYEWKSDNTRMDGVLAHELQEVLPYAVTGVKDGEQMQGVDYSKIVPVLIQAIKDQQVQIEQLKNK